MLRADEELLTQAGYIVDDEMNRLLVNPLPHGVRLHAIIDACHSGSALDLEFKCKVKDTGVRWKNEFTRRPSIYKVLASSCYHSSAHCRALGCTLPKSEGLGRVGCKLKYVTSGDSWR